MKFYFFAICILLGVGAALILSNPLGKSGSIPIEFSVNDITKGIKKGVDGIDGLSDFDSSSTPVDKPIDKPVDRPIDRPIDRPVDRSSLPLDIPSQQADRPSFERRIDRPVDRPVVVKGSVVCPVKGYEAVNIRSSPQLDGKILTYALCNESIEIIDKSNDVWTYIKYKNYIGYMYSDAVNTL